jgi:FtsZ-binding cell division protein ZapB
LLRGSSDLKTENEMLRLTTDMWRTRAEAHAAATVSILNFARTAKEHAARLQKERDELQWQYDALKQKLGEPE